jgi:hypothetical protein
VLATPEQIGWFDEGEWSDELCDIELKHYNRILERYYGWILIEMMETEEDEDELTPVIYNNKVTIAYADLEDEDDEDEDDPDEPNDDQIYNNFNHEGGIKY